ncbi:Hypothetical predicted protein, partial [Paramuricea clavata]
MRLALRLNSFAKLLCRFIFKIEFRNIFAKKVKILELSIVILIASYCTLATATSRLGHCTLASNEVLTIEATPETGTGIPNVFDLFTGKPSGRPFPGSIESITGIVLKGNFGGATSAIGLEITNTISNSSAIVLNLINKFIIDSDVNIAGSKSGFALTGSRAIVNAEIVNNGTIKGGVHIGNNHREAFPLRSEDHNGNIAKFTNLGTVDGGFVIKGTKAQALVAKYHQYE